MGGAGALGTQVDAAGFIFFIRGNYVTDGVAHDVHGHIFHGIWELGGVVPKDVPGGGADLGFWEDGVSGVGLHFEDYLSLKVSEDAIQVS